MLDYQQEETKTENVFAILREKHDWLAAGTWQGIRGVRHFLSGKPGPKLGITVSTHGNEPCGLLAMRDLMDRFESGALNHIAGEIFFVLNNIQASENYISGGEPYDNAKNRFTDIDMNRLPLNFRELSGPVPYEVARARELLPVWAEFDASVDVHSTSLPTKPMVVERNGASGDLSACVPIASVLRNAMQHAVGCGASELYGDPETHRGIVIEGGQHAEDITVVRTVEGILRVLAHLNMVDRTDGLSGAVCQDIYDIFDTVIFPDPSYEFIRAFENFEPLKEGDVIARGNGSDIVAPEDSVVLFAKPFRKPPANALNYEMMFLSKPVRSSLRAPSSAAG